MHSLYTQEPGERVIDVIYSAAQKKHAIKKRVAAYCRVSTDSDAQLGSLENQMQAFRHQLALHEDWELVQIYADEGITGTSIRHRTGFRQMIADCEAGKIDYILTKSISRFARNTMDCLNYVRMLQGMGVQIYFEKEGIDTAESISEILLTVMAAFAQEESRSISENVKWGMRKRFEAGVEWRVPIYGYRHTENERYIIVPEEAAIVREVFTRYAHGETPSAILRDMVARKVPPPNGNTWKLLQLQRMLHNEKYTGDVVLQKNYIESHLTHREVRNTGEIPLYHIRNDHPAIIDRHLFAQAAAISRMRQVRTGNSSYPYDTMLKCPRCGETLVHGSLNSLYFGGKRVRRSGGWGCYGQKGCRQFLLIQSMLDEAMLDAYQMKYCSRPARVDYWWLDELVEEIELSEEALRVRWRDGETLPLPLRLPHEHYHPSSAATRYNAYLDRLRSGEARTKGKFTMGLSLPKEEAI